MSELPRVLLCSFDVVPAPTGSSWRLSESIRALGSHFQTVVLTLKTPDLTHIQTLHGARLLRVPVADADLESRLQTFARAVRRQLESEEYVLVQFTDPYAGQVLCEERPRPGHRLVYDAAQLPSFELSQGPIDTPEPRRFLARLHRQELSCLMNADAVITASPLGRTHLDSLGVPGESLHLLRTPVGLSGTPRPLPTEGEGLHLIYLGSAAPWQGLETLLEAVARVRSEVPLHLRIAGPEHPVLTAQLRAKAEALGLTPETVKIDGPLRREQLAAALAEADLGLLPLTRCDRNEVVGAPLAKLGDYLAAGRGVVAADVAAARAVLPDDCAAFFAPGDPQALAEQLLRLARAPEERAQMGVRARRHAEDKLGVLAFRRTLRALYQKLLGGSAQSTADADDDPDEQTQLHDDFAPTLQRRNLRAAGAEDRTAVNPSEADEPSPGATTDPAVMLPETSAAPEKATLLEIAAVEAPEVPWEPAESAPPEPALAGEPAPPAGPLAPVAPDPAQAPRGLDPWQALVLHGYCPPPTSAFSRPTPPTTFPGREERERTRPPSLPSMPAVPSKS